MKYKPTNLAENIEARELANQMAPFPPHDKEIIKDLKVRQTMITRKQDFNNVPVTYCKTCLSLHLKTIEFPKGSNGENRNLDYCVPCGNTELGKSHIEEWEEIYEERYGEKFLNNIKDD